ncbi:RNA polymerase sigma-70 factor (ECF subfamily) [Parabacteroides sp. PF5-5]|uniref:RNA polymerase sigma-70 factor n=1 Tax=unclassified Parabacteroides TaxID=2649774 RepID=UPI002475B6E2|nr:MULTISPECIES: RNA polymerase sigma-70 factor [unclassified Parabacteroides]MDH6305776.1 RNA polymerase sigma-70 factor (ECF subfamily) [Parabacteroides sp. PH5-39]MDH6317787.1 RNA polymerase sigma-70 factor (ECF subfamily) [Parabacteroides sp. PF5-13]MDH6320618.1 RNA polymerase sigma-70 factor (ECF subfamily) [Parabacteroides sp. PH5-13]MDH6324219.1 RNA polymerase sigma-70 factor (ECF subfamily) [Parabacteroides sp. PH5-8]MDH6328972.1 RNA polymerase sigma-70 factor (ECF subfamily) [Parabact
MTGDLSVLKKIKEGDIGTFEKVFRMYYSPLCLYAAGITGKMYVAEEIVQDLFYVFWKDREDIHIFHSLKNYMYGAVRNRSLQYCEHQDVKNRHRETVLSKGEVNGEENPQEALEYRELEELINRTLNKLPERRLRIFRMHRFEGKKYTEIASELSLSVKTIEAEITKALQMLRKEIENYTHIA